MASDKSISSGLSFSKWVKNKFGDRYQFIFFILTFIS